MAVVLAMLCVGPWNKVNDQMRMIIDISADRGVDAFFRMVPTTSKAAAPALRHLVPLFHKLFTIVTPIVVYTEDGPVVHYELRGREGTQQGASASMPLYSIGMFMHRVLRIITDLINDTYT